MSQLAISNFKYGLDGRRSMLSSVPGTLLTANNVHVNEGGEVEKRKAFAQLALPGNTYGAQETSTGIVVFGSMSLANVGRAWTLVSHVVTMITSNARPVNFIIGATVTVSGGVHNPVINGTFVITGISVNTFTYTVISPDDSASEATVLTLVTPAPALYQQLTHPLGSGVSMTGVVSSTLFGNNIFVITTWSNGDTLEYYNGVLVSDYVYGLQGTLAPSPYNMATQLVAQANASGLYTATQPALPAFLYTAVTGGTHSAGVNTIASITYNFQRSVTLNVGGNPVTASSFVVTTGSVDWTTSNNNTASLLVTSINANTYGFTTGGSATNVVDITPPATDYYGNTLGVQGTDILQVVTTGNVTMYVPTNAATFDVFSIPTQASPSPYNVQTNAVNATINSLLLSQGTPSSAAVPAVGQFSITKGAANLQGTGSLTINSTTQPLANSMVVIGTYTYTFVTALTTTPFQVLIDTNSTQNTLINFQNAINGGPGAGTKYSGTTTINTQVVASNGGAHVVTITSIAQGTQGNITTTSSSGNLVWGSGTLTGGTDVNYIYPVTVAGTNLLAALVAFNQTESITASNVAAAINNYSATSGYTAFANSNVVIISPVVGSATINNSVVNVACVAGVCIDNCTFYVSGTSGTDTITSITANGTTITNGTVTWATSNANFAALLAANIIVKGLYNAVSSGNQVWISPITAANSDYNSITVVATYTNSASVSSVSGSAGLVATQNTINVNFEEILGSRNTFSIGWPNSAIVNAIGGTGPYSWAWSQVSSSGVSSFTAVNATTGTGSSTTQFWISGVPNPTTKGSTATWKCVVTDSVPTSVTVLFQLYNAYA